MNQDDDIPAIIVFLMIVFHSSKNTSLNFFYNIKQFAFYFLYHTDDAVELKTESMFLTCFEVKFVLFQNVLLIVKTYFKVNKIRFF